MLGKYTQVLLNRLADPSGDGKAHVSRFVSNAVGKWIRRSAAVLIERTALIYTTMGKMHSSPKKPDRSLIPSYPGEELREVIYSGDGHTRASITESRNGGIRLRLESWMYWDYAGKEEWFLKSNDPRAHVLDSISRANEMALALFQNEAPEENT